jgi:hypothetical protein
VIDYDELKNICITHSDKTADLIDMLIHYAAEYDQLDKKLNQQLSKYKHITRKLEKSAVPLYKAQYICHRIFKKDGLIKKYLKHSAFKNLKEAERGFLEYWADHPWRFSFSVLQSQPANMFFEMYDVFTGDSFLLYSPGTMDTLKEQTVILWFNLIAFNGSCWQSYGPICGYSGFEPDDLQFYTSLLEPDKWPLSSRDIITSIENNPLPYFMIWYAALFPLTYNKEHQIIGMTAEYEYDDLSMDKMGAYFEIDSVGKIYRLRLKDWNEVPHFAVAYFDENKKILKLSALTEAGFLQLIKVLIHIGYDLSYDPDFRINFTMITAAKEILKKDFKVDPYDHLFHKKVSQSEQKSLDKINGLMGLLVPEINAGRVPDVEAMARQAGVSVETARQIADQLMKTIRGVG